MTGCDEFFTQADKKIMPIKMIFFVLQTVSKQAAGKWRVICYLFAENLQ